MQDCVAVDREAFKRGIMRLRKQDITFNEKEII